MFKKSIVTSAVLMSLSCGVFAADFQHFNTMEPTGNALSNNTTTKTSSTKKYSTSSVQTASKSSTTDVAAKECTASELAGLSGTEFANYVLESDQDCMSFLFGAQQIDRLYSPEKIDAVLDLTEASAASYDGSSGDNSLIFYLRGAYYQQFYNPTIVDIDDATHARILAVVDAYTTIPGFMDINTEQHGQMMFEMLGLMDGTSEWTRFYDFVKAYIQTVSEYRLNTYGYQIAYNQASFFIYRGQVNDRDGFGATVLGVDNEIAGLLANIVVNPLVLEIQEYLADNYANQLGNLLEFDGALDSVKTAVQRVIDANERLSSRWMNMVTAIDRYDTVECTEFTGNVCADDQLRAEVEALVFPNTFEFDGGAMVFHTSLSREEIEQVFYQLKEVEGNFFKVTGATEPVAGDVNDTAIFRIYGSQQEYTAYQSFLYGLNSNNGGIYIERDATLYTWDREEWESTFTLEELARHEFVHYLISRYMIPGYWGETEMYANDRVTWVDEGMANFLAGGTQYEGIEPLRTMLGWVEGREDHYTPSETVSVTYSDQLMYPYSALLFNYLHDEKSDVMSRLVAVLRNDDVAGYDALRSEIGSSTSASGFTTYIEDGIANLEDLDDPWKQYASEATLWYTDAADVEWEIANDYSDLVGNVMCNSMSDIQFGCTMTIDYDIQNADTPLFEVHDKIDAVVSRFVTSTNGNLTTANCYPVDVELSSQEIRCEGGLRSTDTDYQEENVAPEAFDTEVVMDEDTEQSGRVEATDANVDDTLTYRIVTQPTNGMLELDADTGEYMYTPEADFNGTDVFTFIANDGDLDSNEASVSFIVNDVEEPNTPPTAEDVSISVTEGDSVTANLSGTDEDGDDVTYTIVTQPGSGSLEVDEGTGEFTYTPSIESGTVTFTYTVTDGRDESNVATVTITVNEDTSGGSSTPAPSTPSTSAESSDRKSVV